MKKIRCNVLESRQIRVAGWLKRSRRRGVGVGVGEIPYIKPYALSHCCWLISIITQRHREGWGNHKPSYQLYHGRSLKVVTTAPLIVRAYMAMWTSANRLGERWDDVWYFLSQIKDIAQFYHHHNAHAHPSPRPHPLSTHPPHPQKKSNKVYLSGWAGFI